jgi:cytochrome c1
MMWRTTVAGGIAPRLARIAAGAALALGLATGTASAASETQAEVRKQDWSFAGVFGQYDQQQLQRGFKVYQQACATCHSMEYVAFRNLTSEDGPNFSEEAVKAIAEEWPYKVTEISNETGQPFERAPTLTDKIPGPYDNEIMAAQANGGAVPPDFSLIAKARAVHRGFPGFVVDAFAGYAENGPDYIYALLLGYQDPPPGEEPLPGSWYNPVFMQGPWISMPPPLRDGQIEYTDGSPETLEQYSADISAFLMWAAEPKLEERKEIGFRVMVFLAVFAVLLYLTKRKIWSNVKH